MCNPGRCGARLGALEPGRSWRRFSCCLGLARGPAPVRSKGYGRGFDAPAFGGQLPDLELKCGHRALDAMPIVVVNLSSWSQVLEQCEIPPRHVRR